MRRHLPSILAFLVAFGAACSDDPVMPGAGDGSSPSKPQLDHTTAIPSVVVDVNNYLLRMSPNEIFDGIYKGQYLFFAGQVAYGTDGSHVYFYDTRGLTESFVDAGVAPFVELSTADADHYTAALLVESDDQTGGERQHLDVVTVRESFAFSTAPDDDYVIVRYTLANPTDADIAGAHLGFFADQDVIDATVNATHFDEGLQAAVSYHPDHAVRSAVVLLDRSVAAYQHWVNPTFGLGPDLSDPDSYAGWFDLLSGTGDSGELSFYDIRDALTTTPVDIPANGSVSLSVALVAGDDDADLAANVEAARARFGTMSPATPTVHPVEVVLTAGDAVFTGVISFDDETLANAFVAETSGCGTAPVTVTSTAGASVSVQFDRLDVDPNLVTGDRVYCGGRLADGSFFSGHDTPELPDSRIHLTAVVTEPSADWAPTWSPDGHTVAYSSDRDGTRAIWILDTAVPAAEPVKLTAGAGGGELAPDWSPDGQEIVFSRDGGIFAIDVGSGAERQITLTAAERNFEVRDIVPRWSPDGSQIAVWRFVDGASALEPKGNNIFVLPATGDLDGSGAVALSHFLGLYPEWGADGLVYFTGTLSADEGGFWAVYAVDPAGGAPTRTTPVEESQNRQPALSPNGGTLAFTHGFRLVLQDNALLRHTVATLSPSVLVNPFGRRQNVEFSPDGARVIFATEIDGDFQTVDGDIYVADFSPLLDPVARAEGLAASVQSLVDAGLLDEAGGAMLIESLEDVATKLENGQITAALKKVNAYINQVNALIESRRVGEIEGQQLIDGGTALADQISG